MRMFHVKHSEKRGATRIKLFHVKQSCTKKPKLFHVKQSMNARRARATDRWGGPWRGNPILFVGQGMAPAKPMPGLFLRMPSVT